MSLNISYFILHVKIANRKNKFQTIYTLKRVQNFVFSLILYVTFFTKIFLKFIMSLRRCEFLPLRFYLFLSIYLVFLPLLATKKLIRLASVSIISAVFWLRIISDRLLKNYQVIIIIWLAFLPLLRLGGGSHTDPPRIKYLKKPSLRAIKLK